MLFHKKISSILMDKLTNLKKLLDTLVVGKRSTTRQFSMVETSQGL
jgi:hypothetical protein